MAKKRHEKQRKWGAFKYGLGGYLGSSYGFAISDTSYQTFKDRRAWKKRYKGNAGLGEYWKKNPEAYKFYKYKKAKGETKSVNRLLNTLQAKRQKLNPPPNYFKTWKRMFDHQILNQPGQLNMGDVNYIRGYDRRMLKYGVPIILGSTVLSSIYGYHKRKRRKK